jgi:hypothetical protein
MRRALALGALLACSGGTRTPEPSTAPAAPVPAPAALGVRGDAALGVIVWPSAWPQLRVRALGLAQRLGVKLPADLSAAMAEKDPFVGLAKILAIAGARIAVAERPPGIDDTRPIRASLFIPIADPLEVAARVASMKAGLWLRAHHVAIPATAPGELANYLETTALVGAAGHVTVVPGEGMVEVHWFTALGERPAADPILPAPPPPRRTAAVAVAAGSGESLARVIVHPRPLRQVSTLLGLAATGRAVASSGQAPHHLLAAGIGESLTGWLIQDPRAALVGDAAIDLPSTGALRVEMATDLTEIGARAFAAGGAGDKPIELFELDHFGIVEATEPAPIVAATKSDDVLELLLMCGAGCTVHALIGNAHALLKPALADPETAGDIREGLSELRSEQPPGLRTEIAIQGGALVGRIGFAAGGPIGAGWGAWEASAAAAPESGCQTAMVLSLARGLQAARHAQADELAAILGKLRAEPAMSCSDPGAAHVTAILDALTP